MEQNRPVNQRTYTVFVIFTIIFFILINCVFLPTVLNKFRRIDTLTEEYQRFHRDNVATKGDALKRFFYNEKKDCLTTATVCTSNQTCKTSCATGPVPFTCHPTSRLCVATKKPQQKNKADKDANQCYPHLGVIAVLQGNTELDTVTWSCVSLFPHLINAQGKKQDGVCEDGKFNVNVRSHFPNIADCVCPPTRTLYTFSGRTWGPINSVSDIPRCLRYPYLYV